MVNRELLRGCRMLVVDDEVDLREAIAYDFKKLGCKVTMAASGHEAFQLVQGNQFDAIISDVRMPNGTGIELLENTRKIYEKLPVILLVTGFADLSEAEAIEKGALGRIEKPINRNLMIETVCLALASLKPPTLAS